MLTHCDSGNNELGHKHCCTYSQGVFHQMDFVKIINISDTIDCLFVCPVQGDAVSGFYKLLGNDSKLVAFPNVPTGMLQVVSAFTSNIFSCNNSEYYRDAHTAKLDFDNEIRVSIYRGVRVYWTPIG